MIVKGNIIIAGDGKVFRRIESGEVFGHEMALGYSHYIGGVLQVPSHKDEPEDFEEIDSTEEISDTEALNIILGNDE